VSSELNVTLYLPLASVTVVTALPRPAGPFQGETKTVTPDAGAPSSSVATPDS